MDPVAEVVARTDMEHRESIGEVDGERVVLSVFLGDEPTVQAQAGRPARKVSETFPTVHQAVTAYEDLAEEYGLEEETDEDEGEE